jgi:ketosteroid isomerase-like protein
MNFTVNRLFELWLNPAADDDEAEAAFRELYTDPVIVNGAALTAADLVARARAVLATYGSVEREVIDVVEAPGKVVVAFRLRGTHIGPLNTSLGVAPPTGKPVEMRVIDILTLSDGRISEITMVADELTGLHQLGLVRLVEPAT